MLPERWSISAKRPLPSIRIPTSISSTQTGGWYVIPTPKKARRPRDRRLRPGSCRQRACIFYPAGGNLQQRAPCPHVFPSHLSSRAYNCRHLYLRRYGLLRISLNAPVSACHSAYSCRTLLVTRVSLYSKSRLFLSAILDSINPANRDWIAARPINPQTKSVGKRSTRPVSM